MANGIVPYGAYFPAESLLQAKQRGEQIRSMQEEGSLRKAQLAGQMRAYGAATPEEMFYSQATAEQAQAEEAARARNIGAAGALIDSLGKIVAGSNYNPEVIASIKSRPDIAEAVSPIFNLETWTPHAKGEDFVYSGDAPLSATVDGAQGQLEPGMSYTKFPDGSFETRPITAEDRKAIEGATVDTTALVKNTKFIAKTLKIPEAKALDIAMQAKTKTREQFIMDMVARAQGMGLNVEKARANAEEIYDGLFPEEKTEEVTQDWLSSVLEEE
jgi:hypothetical protein